jgi:hypothetical protein
MEQPVPSGITGEPKKLPPLPLTYARTDDPTQAALSVMRHMSKTYPPLSDERITQVAQERYERSHWYMSPVWREKGEPTEQVEFEINGKKIGLYNFCKEKSVTLEHLAQAENALKKLVAHHPQILEHMEWILINDKQDGSQHGDDEQFPLNGSIDRKWKALLLQPRALDPIPHRIPAASNWEGTLVHEATHFLESEFETEWKEKFQWEDCADYAPEGQQWGKGGTDWEPLPTPNGRKKRYRNTKTGEFAPIGKFPKQPEQCVTKYAEMLWNEDVCESNVAYMYDLELLRSKSPNKLAILESHNQNQEVRFQAKRMPAGQVKLPEISPQTVYYFVKEPEPQAQAA